MWIEEWRTVQFSEGLRIQRQSDHSRRLICRTNRTQQLDEGVWGMWRDVCSAHATGFPGNRRPGNVSDIWRSWQDFENQARVWQPSPRRRCACGLSPISPLESAVEPSAPLQQPSDGRGSGRVCWVIASHLTSARIWRTSKAVRQESSHPGVAIVTDTHHVCT